MGLVRSFAKEAQDDRKKAESGEWGTGIMERGAVEIASTLEMTEFG